MRIRRGAIRDFNRGARARIIARARVTNQPASARSSAQLPDYDLDSKRRYVESVTATRSISSSAFNNGARRSPKQKRNYLNQTNRDTRNSFTRPFRVSHVDKVIRTERNV